MADSTAGRGAASELVFMALGGLGEIGMNVYLYGLGPADARRWLMVDLGVTFPGEMEPGVDVVLPDVRFISENRKALDGILITHAHEDHIGATGLQGLGLRNQPVCSLLIASLDPIAP